MQKREFTIKALAMNDPFATTTSMAADLKAALDWQGARSPEDVMKEREAIVVEVENAGKIMWGTGRCDRWSDGCDQHVKKVRILQAFCD